MDSWNDTWNWAGAVWGDNSDYSFNRFFNAVADKCARARGWEEVGSSDVWHISYGAVRRARAEKINSRDELMRFVLDSMA